MMDVRAFYSRWTQQWRCRRWQPSARLKAVEGRPWRWQAQSSDQGFRSDAGGRGWPRGWYRLSLQLKADAGTRAHPRLYMDRPQAGGLADHEMISLPLDARGCCRRRVVLLPRDAQWLYLEPGLVSGVFSMPRLHLRRIPRPVAAYWLLLDMLRRRAPGERWPALLWQAWQRLRHGGASGLASWLLGRGASRDPVAPGEAYADWMAQFDHLPLRRPLSPAAGSGPLISIIVPVYNTPSEWLRRCIDSVLAQSCGQWELCLCDDASTHPEVAQLLSAYASHPRIRVHRRARNGHISAASNDAIALATGDYLALLDHDDELHPQAIQEVVAALIEHPEWKILYTDEDKIDVQGRRSDAYFKPDWNPELILGQNFVSHLGVYEAGLVRSVGGFRQGLEGSQDWDLLLRCAERVEAAQIGHLPRVLYHWRTVPGSTARGSGEKSYAARAGRQAVSDALARRGIAGEVLEMASPAGLLRVRRHLPAPAPRVSLIIPTRDRLDLLARCVESVLERTVYPDYQLLIVDNGSVEAQTLAWLQTIQADPRVKVWRDPQPFNYSRINNAAVERCDGEIIALLNNDIEVISRHWLEEMVSHAVQPEVGAVGAMLYYPDDSIQHAGIVLGVEGVACHAYRGRPRHYPGQMGRARLAQAMMAVTAACLVVRRALYQAVGGLDPALQVAFNDVDFCLRLDAAGYRNVWTPFAELYHHESASRGLDTAPEHQARFQGEIDFMLQRWRPVLRADRYYSPNLSLEQEAFVPAFPPRGRLSPCGAMASARPPP